MAQIKKDTSDLSGGDVKLDYSYGIFVAAIGPVLVALGLATKLE